MGETEVPNKRIDRHIIDLLRALDAAGQTSTQLRIWTMLGSSKSENITDMARKTGRNRRSIRDTVKGMLEKGHLRREGNSYAITEAGEAFRREIAMKATEALSPQCKSDLWLIASTPPIKGAGETPG